MSSVAASVADTQLGLSAAEISILRQQSTLAFQAPAHASGRSNASSTRGRGTSRTSASVSSSRAASAASSHHNTHAPGRLLLDPGSLNVLGAHFDRLMQRIQERVEDLTEQSETCAAAMAGGAARTVQEADREIARMHDAIRQIDELEAEFEKVKRIRDVVKTLRARVDSVKQRMR